MSLLRRSNRSPIACFKKTIKNRLLAYAKGRLKGRTELARFISLRGGLQEGWSAAQISSPRISTWSNLQADEKQLYIWQVQVSNQATMRFTNSRRKSIRKFHAWALLLVTPIGRRLLMTWISSQPLRAVLLGFSPSWSNSCSAWLHSAYTDSFSKCQGGATDFVCSTFSIF